MLRPNRPGQPTKFNADDEAKLLWAVQKVLVPNQIAKLAKVPVDNLYDWLSYGERDLKEGKDNTQLAQFFLNFHQLRAEKARELLEKLEACPKVYQPLIWMLEKCFRDDFGPESEEMRELKKMFFMILESKGIEHAPQKIDE